MCVFMILYYDTGFEGKGISPIVPLLEYEPVTRLHIAIVYTLWTLFDIESYATELYSSIVNVIVIFLNILVV